MFEKLGAPAFLIEAREKTDGARFASPLRTFFAFLLVYMISNFLQGALLTPVLLVMLFTDGNFWALASGGAARYEELLAYTDRFMNDPLVLVGSMLTGLISIGAAIVFCRVFEKRSLSSMGARRPAALASLLGGAVTALVLVLLAVGFAYAFGALRIEAAAPRVGLLIALLFGSVAVGFAQEFMFRGYLMTSLARVMPLSRAWLLSAALFAVFYPAAAGATPLCFLNLFLLGLLLGLYMIRGGNLWGAAVLHAVWRAVAGPVFGLSLGTEGMPTSLFTTVFSEDAALLSGGALGWEGGIALTFALTLGLAFLGMQKTKTDGAS